MALKWFIPLWRRNGRLSNGHVQQNEELSHHRYDDSDPYNFRDYYYYRSLPQEECPNQESETVMNMKEDHKPTTIDTSNIAEELLVFVVSFEWITLYINIDYLIIMENISVPEWTHIIMS